MANSPTGRANCQSEGSSPAPRAANRFHLLVGAEAFLRDVRTTVAGARTRVLAQFMTYEGDESGRDFSAMLAEKAGDGLDVRLFVDHYTDVILSDVYPTHIHQRAAVARERARTQEMLDALRAAGVPVRRTAPVGPLGCYLFYRNHKKMVVIDETVAYVGGINVSDHNFLWHDFMVRIEGPLVADLARDFLSTWDGATVPFDRRDQGGDFLLNQCAGRYPIFDETVAMIGRARSSVVLHSPYLLGDRFESALRGAAERGVRVTAIIPYRSNRLLFRVWFGTLLRRIDHPNVRVMGYRGGRDMTHAKYLVVDGKHASFGSYNMCELEGLTQKELNVFTSNPDFLAQMRALIESDLAASAPLAVPRSAPGRLSYAVLHAFFRWWTGRLLRNDRWRRTYC